MSPARATAGPLVAVAMALSTAFAPALAPVNAAVAESIGIEAWSAVLRAPDRAVLSAPASGLVIDVTVREGDRVASGSPLVSFDCTLPSASFDRAEARLRYARLDHASNEQLANLDSVSDLELAQSALQLVEATSDLAEARHAVTGCVVFAPFDGVVLRRAVRAHETVAAGVELIELVDQTTLGVEFLAPSSAVTGLRAGDAFDFEIGESGETRTGRIDAVIPEIDPVSRTVTVLGTLDPVAPGESGETDAPERSGATLVSGMSGWVTPR